MMNQAAISSDTPILIRHRGREIIRQVLIDHQVCADDFFERNLRMREVTSARCDAARRLSKLGYSVSDMCRLLKRNHSTILNYLNPDYRSRKREAAYRKSIKRRVLQILSPDIRQVVLAIAECENVTPETIISEWVRERASYEASQKEAA